MTRISRKLPMTFVPRNIAACALALWLWPTLATAQTRTVPPPRFGGTQPAAKPVAPTTPAPTTPAAPTTPGAIAVVEPTLPGEKEAVQDCKKFPNNKKFKWELRGEVDLMTMLNAISPMLCRPFIIPGTLRQSKVTILAPDTMTAPEAYRMFLAALESMGLTVQPQGKVLKIIESARARESAIPIYSEDNNPPAQDQYVTRLLRLEHVPVEDVKGVLDRLKGKDGDITVYAPTNTLVITDLATNIRKMEEVVQQLDVAMGGERIWVIKLRTLSATDMATTLQQIFGVQARGAAAPPAGGGRRPNLASPKGSPAQATAVEGAALGADMAISQIIPDDRNNLLIIVGTEKAYQRIFSMVRRLDQANSVRGDAASDVVHVIPLANASVDDVAGTLQGLGAGVSRSGGTSGSSAPGGRPQPQQSSSGSTQGQKTILFEGDVRIAADKATNSLVAVATGRDYITLRDLVKKLDVVRRQVFVECVILEVSVDKTRTIGFAWHGGNAIGSGSSQSLLFGGSEPSSDVNSILFSPTSLSGLA
ncbi:MAG: secretin N-terminal domain-containing protein, partial [Polyangia bacterium]